MAGDDEEHAVLLNNYFQTLNRTTYIAIGTARFTLVLNLSLHSIIIQVSRFTVVLAALF